jgi:hypothetical protein
MQAPRGKVAIVATFNGHARADREAEYLFLGRQLRARYPVSLRGTTARGLARALMVLEDTGRIDIQALRAELNGRDEREITRLLFGDARLAASLRGH